MKLEANPFLKAIRSGEPQIGLWMSLSNNFAAEIVAGAGFDWVLIDMEHSPNDLNSVMAQLQVMAAYEGTAIVRPDWNDTVLVKRLLDAGAPALLFPMIQNLKEAKAAVQASCYPPKGVRGVSGTNRANKFGRIKDYFARVEEETAVLLQLETQVALAQAEAIGALEGVDGIFFGPADIAADMGLLGDPMNPKVWDAIMPVAEKLIKAGVPVGTLVLNPDFAKDLINKGFSFVACGSDVSLLARSSDALLAKMKAS